MVIPTRPERDESTSSLPGRPRPGSKALRVAAIYAAFAMAWIILSDYGLQLFAPGMADMTRWATAKGIAFVTVTSALLFLTLRRAFLRDEQRATANAAAAAEKSFSETMIESMPGIVYVFDSSGRFLRWNHNFETVSGYSPGEIAKMHPLDFFSGEEKEIVRQKIEEVFDRGESSVEANFVTRSGRAIPYFFTARRSHCEGVRCLAGVGIDITEQRAVREKLEANAALLRIAGKTARLAGWTIDLPEWKLNWSDENCYIHDLPPGYEATFEEAASLYPPEHREEVRRLTQACARDGTPYEFELPKMTASGRKIWVRSTGEAVRDESGRIIRLQGAIQDVSDRRATEEKLRASENELRALAESMPQMVWMTTPEGLATYYNRQWMDYTGLTLEKSLGEGWVEAFHPEDRQRAWNAWQEAVAGQGAYNIECRIRRWDGVHRWMLARALPYRDEKGRIVKWMGTCTDIQDLKEADAILRAQASLLDLARDAIVVRDLDHRVSYWNQSAERLYGWSADEAKGLSVLELARNDSAAFLDAMKIVLDKGEWNGEMEQTTRSGKKISVESRWTLVRDEHGEPKAVLSINTDITSRKQMESQFLRAQRLESIGTLASGIAHDFNNLLAPIVMGVSYLKRFESRENVLKVIGNIERSADRGKHLVRQVLSFARGAEGSRVALDAGHIVREVASIVTGTFPKDIAFECRVADDLSLVDGDPTQLHQAILNLCVNARDAMPAGGRLLVSAFNMAVDDHLAAGHHGMTPGPYVVLEVTDDGRGIPREVQDRMFEPFFTTKDHGKGTGLGLSTVLGIVRGHGGFIHVESEPEKGSTFRIFIPALTRIAVTESPLPESTELPSGRGELILVVDDEVSILDITRQTLEGYGYRSLVAETGEKAIAIYSDHRNEIAAVITDIMMPVMDGHAVIAALRKINPEVRIIAMSGLDVDRGETGNAVSGVWAFLKKPFSAEQLLVTLRSLIAGPV